MKKTTLGILSLFASVAIFANEPKQIVVSENSTTGQKVLENVQEYKEYMANKQAAAAKAALATTNESCDVEKLKSAVAKIIKRLDNIEANQNTEISSLKNEIASIHEKLEPKKLEALPIANAPICTTKTIAYDAVTKKPIGLEPESSFSSFKTDTFFTPEFDLPTYETPSSYFKPIDGIKLPAGVKFKADKFTKTGWIHVEGGNWVKGFALTPKFLPSAENRGKKFTARKIIYKTESSCNQEKKIEAEKEVVKQVEKPEITIPKSDPVQNNNVLKLPKFQNAQKHIINAPAIK